MLQQQTPSSQSSKLLDNAAPRARLPPPGFSHMNAFGLGVPRASTQTSKILPFMNNGNGGSANNQMPPQSNWPHHPAQPNLNYGLHNPVDSLLSKPNHPPNKNGT